MDRTRRVDARVDVDLAVRRRGVFRYTRTVSARRSREITAMILSPRDIVSFPRLSLCHARRRVSRVPSRHVTSRHVTSRHAPPTTTTHSDANARATPATDLYDSIASSGTFANAFLASFLGLASSSRFVLAHPRARPGWLWPSFLPTVQPGRRGRRHRRAWLGCVA